MSHSKIDYRLKRDFYPLLEESGFVRTMQPREYESLRDGVTCSIQVDPLGSGYPEGWMGTSGNGFLTRIAFEYVSHPPYVERWPDVLLRGVGGFDVSGYLQRTLGSPGGPSGYVWDLEFMTPDEAVADLVAAYQTGGEAFFDLWANPATAWEELHKPEVDEDMSDLGGVYVGSNLEPTTIHLIEFHLKIADLLGLKADQIRLARLMIEKLYPGEPSRDFWQNRLAELEAN